jgi:quinol monooxygenase YgiN
MYTLIAKWYIQANDNDKTKAVLQALRELAAQVEAQEPDTWLYLVHTGNQEGSTPPPAPGEVVFVEAYKDFNALLQHVNGKLFQTFVSQYGADFVPEMAPNKGPFMLVEGLARLAGFVRPQAAESTAKVTGH